MLTFEQFRATRTWHDDLSKTPLSDASLEGVPGFLYVRSLYIDAPAGGAMPALYHLQIGRDEWTCGDLEILERRLYQYGCDEGHCDVTLPAPAKESSAMNEWYKPDQHPNQTWVIGEWKDDMGDIQVAPFYCDRLGRWYRAAFDPIDGDPILHFGMEPIRWETIPLWKRSKE